MRIRLAISGDLLGSRLLIQKKRIFGLMPDEYIYTTHVLNPVRLATSSNNIHLRFIV